MMLKNAMSNTPRSPAQEARGNVQTWVNSQWKNPPKTGQFSVAFNRDYPARSKLAQLGLFFRRQLIAAHDQLYQIIQSCRGTGAISR